jgi:hypothetical protein
MQEMSIAGFAYNHTDEDLGKLERMEISKINYSITTVNLKIIPHTQSGPAISLKDGIIEIPFYERLKENKIIVDEFRHHNRVLILQD